MTTMAPDAPAFRVVGGDPTDEELAALAVVLSALRRQRGTLAPPENPRIAVAVVLEQQEN